MFDLCLWTVSRAKSPKPATPIPPQRRRPHPGRRAQRSHLHHRRADLLLLGHRVHDAQAHAGQGARGGGEQGLQRLRQDRAGTVLDGQVQARQQARPGRAQHGKLRASDRCSGGESDVCLTSGESDCLAYLTFERTFTCRSRFIPVLADFCFILFLCWLNLSTFQRCI